MRILLKKIGLVDVLQIPKTTRLRSRNSGSTSAAQLGCVQDRASLPLVMVLGTSTNAKLYSHSLPGGVRLRLVMTPFELAPASARFNAVFGQVLLQQPQAALLLGHEPVGAATQRIRHSVLFNSAPTQHLVYCDDG